MTELRRRWIDLVRDTIHDMVPDADIPEPAAETPPRLELGDLAVPMFPYARILKKAPPAIAAEVASRIAGVSDPESLGTVVATGPYLNIKFDRATAAKETLSLLDRAGEAYGRGHTLAGVRVMVEFSCPNTNKPLHLGHLRNDAIGESIGRILAAAGAEVRKVNLINDRGIHICKSMAAYERFGEGSDPEGVGRKSDHFVGDFYVRFAQWEKTDPAADEYARELLRKWEAGDEGTTELWRRMNQWTIDGIEETYRRTGIAFDHVYYESETYRGGRDEVLRGLADGVFNRAENGAVVVDLSDIGLDSKVLLRGDGTSLYLTQDIGTAIARHADWPFDRLVYVVGSEQRYHFAVLFEVLKRLGYDWAARLHHLSYGMVNLTEGKMKSREGTVVDADNLLDELSGMAETEIREKQRVEDEGEVRATGEKIALGALHYYLLKTSPTKDMLFDPKESLSFNGDTGPYLQYVCARVTSLLGKAPPEVIAAAHATDLQEIGDSLTEDAEWSMIRLIDRFPRAVAEAAALYDPSALAGYLYELAKGFSRFYHDNPVLTAESESLRSARLRIVEAVGRVMTAGLSLLNIPVIGAM